MKRLWITGLLIAFLFAGCVEAPQDTTTPLATEPLPTEPALYEPDSKLEQVTGGAVRLYRMALDKGGTILTIGSDILVFAYNEDATILTRLSGMNGRPLQCVQLPGFVSVIDNCVRVENNTIAYYDPDSNSVVLLDGMLQQTERIALPEDMLGAPVLSEDLKRVYYAADNQIRKLELDTGISSLLRSQEMELFQPVALAAAGQALECRCVDLEGNAYTEYISTANGQTLAVARDIELKTHGERWFAALSDGLACEYLFGSGEEIKALYLEDAYTEVIPLGSVTAALLPTAAGLRADLFDLDSGNRTASVVLQGICEADSLLMNAAGTGIWLIASDGKQDMLCRWEFGKSATGETVSYVGNRYTPDTPDEEGLLLASQRMRELSERYGVDLKLWNSAQSPEGYAFQKEFRGAAADSCLDAVEQTLAMFPDGFFKQLEDGKLSVEIVNAIAVISEDAPESVHSVAYWEKGQGHIALAVSPDAGAAFCAALSHILDAHIYGNSLAYDEWDRLNPNGFSYDLTYRLYETRQDGKWLSGDERAFVSEFSKTFAREDRASIFVSAMEAGNEEVFSSPVMQKKLQCICKAIREAFGWKKDERSFLWEQYLQT